MNESNQVHVGHLKRNTTSGQSLSASIWLMTKYGYHRRHFTDLSGVPTALTDSAYGYHRGHFTDLSGVKIALTDIVGS